MIQPSDYCQAFEPAPDVGLAEHSIRCVINEEGRPFDFLAFPHLVACGGPCDAFDADWVREIVLQWASRLGKTFLVLCGSLYMAELAPCNQMLAGHVQDLALQQAERIRSMGAHNPAFDNSGLQTSQKKRLEFCGNQIYAAWARSPGTLSNVNALYGGASELDLWERVSTSKHPDPEQMFAERFKDNDPIRKEIYESIPTLQGKYIDENEQERPRSRIEARRLQGTNCQFWVGCPFCGGRQVLTVDRVTAAGYQCEHCSETIADEYRKAFIRSGVWAPSGCTVEPDRATAAAQSRLELLAETAERPADASELVEIRDAMRWHGWAECDYVQGWNKKQPTVESFQLSSLYALSLSWERIAAEKDKNGETQNFVNQWLGETFEVQEAEQVDLEAEGRELAATIRGELPWGQLPEWVEYRILTIDRQKRTFPWMLTGWNAALDVVHVACAAAVLSFDELHALIEKTQPDAILMDCGYLQAQTYDWCVKMQEQGYNANPCKGAKASTVIHHFKEYQIEDEYGFSAEYASIRRLDVNTQSTQEWVTELLETRTRVRVWDADTQSICMELLNDVETVKQIRSTWDRIDRTHPNDQRDNLRYAFVAAQYCKEQSQQQGFDLPTGRRRREF